MKYYKINIKVNYGERIASAANGKNVPDNELYFSKMRKGDIITNSPVFDYFVLSSYDEEKYWEWNLFDVFYGIGDFPYNGNWYISDKLKVVLDNYKIAPPYYFYETKLLFKHEKLKYWVFQFIAAYRKLNKMEFVNFIKSEFSFDNQKRNFNSYQEWSDRNSEVYDKNNTNLQLQKVCLNIFFDFLPLNPISSDIICSEQLKKEIENSEITGFEFSELDYEVKVENNGSVSEMWV